MTFNEANKIFKAWQQYMEIHDKIFQIFHTIPESFLPYPIEVLEEALNIVAKEYFDSGDKKKSENIQTTICFLLSYKKDEEAIEGMKKGLDLILGNPKLKDVYLRNLRRSYDSWMKIKLSVNS